MLTAVAALESVREWSSSLRFFSWETSPTDKTNDINGVVPLRSFRASSSDVIVSGHSMGGHGAWILATHLLNARLLGVAVLVRESGLLSCATHFATHFSHLVQSPL